MAKTLKLEPVSDEHIMLVAVDGDAIATIFLDEAKAEGFGKACLAWVEQARATRAARAAKPEAADNCVELRKH